MARIVVDANVLVSAAFGGTPLDAVSKAFSIGEIYLSPAVAAEIEGTIERLSPKLGEEKAKNLKFLWGRFRSFCHMVEPREKVSVCRYPKHVRFLRKPTEISLNLRNV